MASSTKKIIAIVGATGKQGSSVARTFLSLPNWHVRCLTRQPDSAASENLRSQGAEIILAELADITSLSRAFENANAIFLNTDFFATFYGNLSTGIDVDTSSQNALQTEVTYGKNAVKAAAQVPTLERFVYSAFISMNEASEGKYHRCFHWEGKAHVVKYIEQEQPALAQKTSFFYPGGYNTNALLSPKTDSASGELAFVLPFKRTAKMPIFDPLESTGPLVRALIEDEAPGTRLLGCDTDSHLSIAEIVDIWSRITGKEVRFTEITTQEMHEKTQVPLEVLEAAPFISEFGYTFGLKVMEPSQLRCKLETKSFEQWLREKVAPGLVS